MNWRNRVLATAVCELIWARRDADLAGLRRTLDALLAGNYQDVPCLSDIISQFSKQEMIVGNSKEDRNRHIARQQIAQEILNSMCELSPAESAFLKYCCRGRA